MTIVPAQAGPKMPFRQHVAAYAQKYVVCAWRTSSELSSSSELRHRGSIDIRSDTSVREGTSRGLSQQLKCEWLGAFLGAGSGSLPRKAGGQRLAPLLLLCLLRRRRRSWCGSLLALLPAAERQSSPQGHRQRGRSRSCVLEPRKERTPAWSGSASRWQGGLRPGPASQRGQPVSIRGPVRLSGDKGTTGVSQNHLATALKTRCLGCAHALAASFQFFVSAARALAALCRPALSRKELMRGKTSEGLGAAISTT